MTPDSNTNIAVYDTTNSGISNYRTAVYTYGVGSSSGPIEGWKCTNNDQLLTL